MEGNIKMVKTKLVSVSSTKFSPHLDTPNFICQKTDTVHSRLYSFKVSAEYSEVDKMYNPELWPEGAFVRCYYEPCMAGVVGSNATLSVGVYECACWCY